MPNVDDQPESSGSFGYLLVLVLFAFVFVLILPLIGMMYMDTMVVKREAKAQMEKVEKLRKSIEEERKNVNPVLIPNQLPHGGPTQNP
jgi:Na+-transporting methylmalonyl-CoA/oxaloacetate decarboxylase gamma subunit